MQVQFITSILGLLWPTLSSAVYKEVLVQAKQPLEDACKMTNGLVASLAITKLDLGTIPPRLDSFKTMHSESDELILEVGRGWVCHGKQGTRGFWAMLHGALQLRGA